MSQPANPDLLRPIIGLENRTALEVFDIMCDRIRRSALSTPLPAREVTEERGPKTEAVIKRDGHFLVLDWWRYGLHLTARVYEPLFMPISAALADVLALALEMRPSAAELTPAREVEPRMGEPGWVPPGGFSPNGTEPPFPIPRPPDEVKHRIIGACRRCLGDGRQENPRWIDGETPNEPESIDCETCGGTGIVALGYAGGGC